MTMDPMRLWAKGKSCNTEEHPSMLLPQHLQDVYVAAQRVLESTGDEQLLALKLEPLAHRERFRRCVLLAAAVHDLGKANDHFQGMICRLPERIHRPQGVRHEWVTVLMLSGPSVVITQHSTTRAHPKGHRETVDAGLISLCFKTTKSSRNALNGFACSFASQNASLVWRNGKCHSPVPVESTLR
jgi:hypothetical protein